MAEHEAYRQGHKQGQEEAFLKAGSIVLAEAREFVAELRLTEATTKVFVSRFANRVADHFEDPKQLIRDLDETKGVV